MSFLNGPPAKPNDLDLETSAMGKTAMLQAQPIADTEPPVPYRLDASKGNTPQADGERPQFRSGMPLDAAGELRLLTRCLTRIDEVKEEMGLDQSYWPRPGGWMDIRFRNQNTYDKDLRWRAVMGGIFGQSNFTLGTNERHTRYLAARIQDDLLGTTPFMAVFGRNPDQEELARQTETYVQQWIDRCGVREKLRSAQKTALIRNEAVVKTTWTVKASPFFGPLDVYVDANGQPVLTPVKGLYIEKNASFLPDPTVQQPKYPDPPPQPQNPQDAQYLQAMAQYNQAVAIAAAAERKVLENDPSFVVSGEGAKGVLTWVRPDGLKQQLTEQHFDRIEQTFTEQEGIDCRALDWRAFLCPLTFPSVHEADINVHYYMETPNRIRQRYGDFAVSQNYFSSWYGIGERQPIQVMGEILQPISATYREFPVAETYICFDADGDGVDEQIIAVIDLEAQRLVFYDYLRNQMKKRPFEVIPGVESVPNRWYGRGVFSMGEHLELLSDAQLNRVNVKSSKISGITFKQRAAVDEWNNGQPVEFGTNKVYDLNPGFEPTKNPPIFRVNLAEDCKEANDLMEIARAASDANFGSISVKDASESDLNQSKTATGVVNLQQASDVITKAVEQDQIPAINAILEQVIDVCLENLDPTTLLLSKEGDKLVMLNRDEIRSLTRDVRLTLTRSRSTQLFQTSQQALTLVVGQQGIAMGYLGLKAQNPPLAKIARPLFINMLRALEVNDADDLCPEVTPEEIQQWQAAQQQKQNTPPKESILTNYKDAPDPIRRQIEAADGFQPLTPEQEQQEAAKNAPPPNEQPARSIQAPEPTGQPARAA
jgi:hypothetical protein